MHAFLLMSFLTAKAFASGCDWDIDGTPLVTSITEVRRIKLTNGPHLTLMCAERVERGQVMCYPIAKLLWPMDDGAMTWEPNLLKFKTPSYTTEMTWDQTLLPKTVVMAMQQEISVTRTAQTELVLENLQGTFDDNCTSHPPLLMGRTRIEVHFQNQALPVLDLAPSGGINDANMGPLNDERRSP